MSDRYFIDPDLLASTPNMMINNRDMMEFKCFLCRPHRIFAELDQHKLHFEEIHNRIVSYKTLLVKHLGPERSLMLGLSQKTEQQVIDLIKRFDAGQARRNR